MNQKTPGVFQPIRDPCVSHRITGVCSFASSEMNAAPSPMSPQRLALDLQQAREELKLERQRTLQLLDEVHRQNIELDRLKNSVHRESNSRLQAEDALDKTRDRLQLAVEAAGLALWDWLLSDPQVFLSARWGEMIGDVVVEGYWDLASLRERVHPNDLLQIQDQLQQLIRGQTPRGVATYRVHTNIGWRWLETHGVVAERDAAGRAIRLMGTHADVTERKRAEEATIHARDLAQQASKTKSEFLANISHEVRTPLNAIMGLTQLLMTSPLNAEQLHWLELMNGSAQALLALLNDVLDLARIEAGKMTVEQVAFSPNDLLEELGALYSQQARSKSIHWAMQLSVEMPSQILGDPGRLRQILQNLLSNAIKFTPSQGRIELVSNVVSRLGDKSPHLEIQVRDTGIGIAPEQREKIFEAFIQADSSTARHYGGSGLGLAISHKLIRLLGGTIALESELGQGSCFTITLPITSTAPTQASATRPSGTASPPASAPTDTNQNLDGMRVLVAEDHPVNQLLMKEFMNALGCRMRLAQNGGEAIAQWEQGDLDLILMDVQMPGTNGLDAARQIRQLEHERQRPHIPIIAITANAMNGDREMCLSAGMDGYISKPLNRERLRQVMLQALQHDKSASTATLPAKPPASLPATASTPAVSSSREKVQQLLVALSDDPQSRKDFAEALSKDLPHRVQLLEQALDLRDATLAIEQAHLLRNALGLISAERESRLARGLEMAAAAGEWSLFSKAFPLLKTSIEQLAQLITD